MLRQYCPRPLRLVVHNSKMGREAEGHLNNGSLIGQQSWDTNDAMEHGSKTGFWFFSERETIPLYDAHDGPAETHKYLNTRQGDEWGK